MLLLIQQLFWKLLHGILLNACYSCLYCGKEYNAIKTVHILFPPKFQHTNALDYAEK